MGLVLGQVQSPQGRSVQSYGLAVDSRQESLCVNKKQRFLEFFGV